MWQDPIVTETRALREQYAKQFGHKSDAIFQDILQRQAVASKQLVTFEPRKPVLSKQGSVSGFGLIQSSRAGIPADFDMASLARDTS